MLRLVLTLVSLVALAGCIGGPQPEPPTGGPDAACPCGADGGVFYYDTGPASDAGGFPFDGGPPDGGASRPLVPIPRPRFAPPPELPPGAGRLHVDSGVTE